MLDHGLAPRILPFFLKRPLPVSSERVLYRCFKVCLSKNIWRFHEKTPSMDCNFIANLQFKPTTLLKLYSKTVFSEYIFGIFGRATFRYLPPLQRRIWNSIENLWWNFLAKIVQPKSSIVDIWRGSKYVSALVMNFCKALLFQHFHG